MPKLKDLSKYDTLVDIQGSDTNADVKYEVRWSKDDGYFCECQGWQSSKKKPKVCKHIKRVIFQLELKDKLTYIWGKEKFDFDSIVMASTITAKEVWGV